MSVRWLTAFIDIPAPSLERAERFWTSVTGSNMSPKRGEHHEFATLIPSNGDAFLRVQRVLLGTGGIHLDLHVEDIAGASSRAMQLGATAVEDRGHRVMLSPAGLTFCLVGFHGESVRPAPVAIASGGTSASTSLVDQVAIDVSSGAFETECRFWSELTGWEVHSGALPEFAVLTRPVGMPLRILLQRLGPDDPATEARAHLDFACGPNVEALAALHRSLGAKLVREEKYWTTLSDPSGFPYCLTRRDPLTGTLTA